MNYIIVKLTGKYMETKYHIWEPDQTEMLNMIVSAANEVISKKPNKVTLSIDGIEYASVDLLFGRGIKLEKIGTIDLPEDFDMTEIKFQKPELRYFDEEDTADIKSDRHTEKQTKD